MSILINKDTKVITQGITGKTGQFHTRMCREYANGQNCFVAGVNPKKAGEDFEGIPIFANVRDAKAKTGANVSVIYVPPAGAADAIWEAVEAELDVEIAQQLARDDLAAGSKLPRSDYTRRNQNWHHARSHPQKRPHRRRLPFRHAHL